MSATILRLNDYRPRPRLRLVADRGSLEPMFDNLAQLQRELLAAQERANAAIIAAWCAGWLP